jgi:hypothetical protein
MKNKILLLFLITTINCIAQEYKDFQDDNWTQEIRRDDFGDLENYYYIEMTNDNFTFNTVIVKLEYNGLAIYQGTNPQNFIKYKKSEAPYTLKLKSGNNYYNDESSFIGSKKGFLHFNKYSTLYKLITGKKGSYWKIVIYNNRNERINSFTLYTFNPVFL